MAVGGALKVQGRPSHRASSEKRCAVISSVYMRKERPVALRLLCISRRNWDACSMSFSTRVSGGEASPKGSLLKLPNELKIARA